MHSLYDRVNIEHAKNSRFAHFGFRLELEAIDGVVQDVEPVFVGAGFSFQMVRLGQFNLDFWLC